MMKLYNIICASWLIGWIVPASGGTCNWYGSCKQSGTSKPYQACFDLVTSQGENSGQVCAQVTSNQYLQLCYNTYGYNFYLSEVQAWASPQLDGYPSIECECTPNAAAFPWNKTNLGAKAKWVCLSATLSSFGAQCCSGGGSHPDQLIYLLTHAQVYPTGGSGEQIEYSVWSQGHPLTDAGSEYTYSTFNLTCGSTTS